MANKGSHHLRNKFFFQWKCFIRGGGVAKCISDFIGLFKKLKVYFLLSDSSSSSSLGSTSAGLSGGDQSGEKTPHIPLFRNVRARSNSDQTYFFPNKTVYIPLMNSVIIIVIFGRFFSLNIVFVRWVVGEGSPSNETFM